MPRKSTSPFLSLLFMSSIMSAIMSSVFITAGAEASINEFKSSTLTMKVFAQEANYEVSLMGEKTLKEVVWFPSVSLNTGVDITINGVLGFGVSGRGPVSPEDELKKGKTEYTDYRFSLAFRAFHLNLNYQNYKGFYLKESTQADPSWDSAGPYIQDPDMKAETGLVSLTWVISPDSFSLEALMDQTKRQEESGGSFLLGLTASQASYSSPNGLIPVNLRGEFGEEAAVDRVKFQAASVRGGFGYTFVLAKAWYLSGALQFGGGPQLGTITAGGVEKTVSQTSSSNNVIMGAGYNGTTVFAGQSLLSDTISYKSDGIEFPQSTFTNKVFVGARF